jgi:hypothetical protein
MWHSLDVDAVTDDSSIDSEGREDADHGPAGSKRRRGGGGVGGLMYQNDRSRKRILWKYWKWASNSSLNLVEYCSSSRRIRSGFQFLTCASVGGRYDATGRIDRSCRELK